MIEKESEGKNQKWNDVIDIIESKDGNKSKESKDTKESKDGHKSKESRCK